MKTMRPICWGLAALLLSGCATSTRQQMEQPVEQALPSDTPENRAQVHADLVRGMLDSGQYYAAIAHIEAQVQASGSTLQLRLYEAEARRQLGQTAQAQALYRELLKSPAYVADAYHGLGLTNSKSDLKLAVWQLQQAAQRRPADAGIRNDLGYALTLARRYPEALHELATAVELEGGKPDSKARNNLVLLMLVTGDEPAVKRIVRETGMSSETLSGLRRQAQTLAARPKSSAS
jgi:Flp pilus assembly protein TadD